MKRHLDGINRTRLLAAVALLPALACAQTKPTPPAQAEVADGEVLKLSVFEVNTSRDVGYQSPNAAEATRMNMAIGDIPMNVTVYNQQFIEDLLATDTSELLAYEASAVKTSENDGFLARGSTSVGSNFLNGFAQTSGFGSQPLANIERVEVLRGPAAVLYGSGGYGGTVNRITKQPQARTFGSARTILGEEASYRVEFDYNSPLPVAGGKKLMFRANGIYDRGYTWFGQRKEEDGLAPSLRWDISRNTKLILEYFYSWRENQASWETPVRAGNPKGMTTGDGAFREIPRKIAWVSPEDYRHNTRQVASIDFRHIFTDNLQFRSQFQFETKDQDNQESLPFTDAITVLKDTVLMPRFWRYVPRLTDNYRTRNEVVWNVESGPLKHRLLAGHSWTEVYDMNRSYRSVRNNGGLTGAALTGSGRLTDAQAGPVFNSFPNLTYAEFLQDPQQAGFNLNNLMPINLFNREAEPPLPTIANRPPLLLDTKTKTYTGNQDFYFNDVFSVAGDRVFFMVGARHSRVERRTITYASGTFPNKVELASPPTVYGEAKATTSSFGAVWHLDSNKRFTLYGNLNKSFNPEFRSQPDGSELKDEEGGQKEVGLRVNLLNGRISGLVTYFDILQDNVTENDPDRPGYFRQVTGLRSTGLELSLNARVTDNWLVFGGFSDTDSRNNRTGVATALSPRFRFTMFNRYNFTAGRLKGLNLSLGTIYTGEKPLTVSTVRNEPNWGPAPAWWRVDAIVGYKLRPEGRRFSWDFSLKVSNLLDNTEIYYVAQNPRYTIDPGRTWSAVVSVKF